jgi:beta-lactamase class A
MLRRKMMDVAAAQRGDENVATPHEMVQLLEAIYKGKVLKADSTKELIKQLSTLKPSYIPRELPDGVQVANKPGELEGVRTDSGIVFSANRPFAISVMTAYAGGQSVRLLGKLTIILKCAAKLRSTAGSCRRL